MKLQDWINDNPIATEMLWKGSAFNQLKFMRDTIGGLLWSHELSPEIEVIGSHRSKSINLPVYQLDFLIGKMILRDNFYNWKVSVDSKIEINADFAGLFNRDKEIHGCYREGFPEELVFGPHNVNKERFTIELRDDYEVYMFVWIVLNFCGHKERKR